MSKSMGAVNLSAPPVLASIRQWLLSRRWFGGKAREIVGVEKFDEISLRRNGGLMLLTVTYAQGEPELYALPFILREGDAGERLAAQQPAAIIHRFAGDIGQPPLLLADGLADLQFCSDLLEMMAKRRSDPSYSGYPVLFGGRRLQSGKVTGWSGSLLESLLPPGGEKPIPTPMSGDQSNSCIVFGRKLILKIFRRIAPGLNPELEIGRLLTAIGFPNIPALCGMIGYSPLVRERAIQEFTDAVVKATKAGTELAELAASGKLPTPPSSDEQTIGVLQQFVEGDSGWRDALNRLDGFFESVAALPSGRRPAPKRAFEPGAVPARESSLWSLSHLKPSAASGPLVVDDITRAELLGRRTAELHLALTSDPESTKFDPDTFRLPLSRRSQEKLGDAEWRHLREMMCRRITPEPFTADDQKSLQWSMRDLAARTCELLRQRLPQVPADIVPVAQAVLASESRLMARFDEIAAEPLEGQKIRCHGDYHLGQVIWTGTDYMIIDFEGEPARPLAERRAKRSPLVDVAGMIRSFHYAASQALFEQRRRAGTDSIGTPSGETADWLQDAADCWYLWSAAAFVRGYRAAAERGTFLPRAEQCDRLLRIFLLEKAVYELGYELNNRPDWVEVPLRGLLSLLGESG